MNATAPLNDLSETPLWRLIVLLDDLERERGADSPEARRIARAIADRLGIVSEIEPTDREGAHVG